MKTGNNRKLFVGLGIGVTFAVILESAIVYGFVGATASMGALGLVALTGLIFFISTRMLLRSYKRRRMKILLRNSMHVEFSDDGYLQYDNAYKSPKGKPVSEKDKRVIVGHIDEFMNELRGGQSRQSAVMVKPITEKDKKKIMEHVDELLVLGTEYGGERSS